MRISAKRSQLTRRAFLATTSATALFSPLTQNRNAFGRQAADHSRDENLAEQIHPSVRIRRDELPAEQNAFWLWREAVSELKPLHEFAEQFARENNIRAETDRHVAFMDPIWEADNPEKPLPTGDARRCVREWIKASRPALLLLERGLKKQRFQFPENHLLAYHEEDGSLEDVSVLRDMARLKRTCLKAHVAEGSSAALEKDLLDLLAIARLAADCGGYLVHYLFAAAVHAMAVEAVTAYARHPLASPATLDKLLSVLPMCRPRVESLAEAFRVEVVYFLLPEVNQLPSNADLPTIVDVLIRRHLLLNQSDPEVALSSRGQVKRVRKGMLALFDGHPAPLDRAETMWLYTSAVATMLDDLSTPWLKRKQHLAEKWLKEVEPWPRSLWYVNDLSISLFGTEERDEAATSQHLAAARTALLKVHNPIGKLMLHYLGSFESVRRAYHLAQLRHDAALVVLATRGYLDETGLMPKRLLDLVEAKFLSSVALDPFSGMPISYDRDRSIIWSFGFDEKDDGGDWDFEADFPDGQDLVWRLPTPA